MSLNKKVPKEVSKGESVVGLAPAMPVTLPLNPLPTTSPKVRYSLPQFMIDIYLKNGSAF